MDIQSNLEKNYIMISPSNTEDDMAKLTSDKEDFYHNKIISGNKIYESAEESEGRSKTGSVVSGGIKKNPNLIYSKNDKNLKKNKKTKTASQAN